MIFVAVVTSNAVEDRVLSRAATITGPDRSSVVKKAMTTKAEWEAKREGREYRVLVGQLTEEAREKEPEYNFTPLEG